MTSIPQGATHVGEFYGDVAYYKKVEIPHLNQVSEEWETLIGWKSWATDEWIDVGSGFSPRRLKELES